MTRYEKFYKNDDRFMIKALAEYLSSDIECEDCPADEICLNDNLSCRECFRVWLLKEVEDA